MALPIVPLAARTLEIGGESVTYRSLSRAEALHLQTFGDKMEDAEVYILVHGTGATEAEVQAFRESTDTATAGDLVDAIIRLSGLEKARHQPGDPGKCPACAIDHAKALQVPKA